VAFEKKRCEILSHNREKANKVVVYAIAQVVNRRFSTSSTGVRSQVRSCEISGG
jgi:hypothetical protein